LINNGNSKIRFLELLKLLKRYSDENHPLSGAQLCKLLQKQGIEAERKSVCRDIALLNKHGFDIIHTRLPKQGYFIAKRDFELPEVRLLMDAVLAAPFITNKKTAELTDKLCGLLSCYQADDVLKQNHMQQRVKFENEEIYYNIDTINRAIAEHKKIAFCYHHRVIANQKAKYDKGRKFVISPYALLWVSDKYYLAGNYDKYDAISNYRLDRMKHVEATSLESRPLNEVSSYEKHFDTSDYLKKTFNMYNGEQEMIALRCSNELLETIVDKFGSDLEFSCHDDHAFTVRASVYVSDGLIDWLLQYGDRITVLSPKSLKDIMIKRIEALSAMYQIKQKTCVQ
jgi:predicted DNA-binding transcriptional regulator YafY